jgi:hypothetical protein
MKPASLYAIPMLLCGILLLTACGPTRQAASATPTIAPADNQTATPLPSAVPAVEGSTIPTSTPASLEIRYTEQNPLTEPDGILAVLDALRLRQEAWFSHPGWYQKKVCNYLDPGRENWMDCLYFLVHVVDEVRTCREQMVYFIIDDQVKPFEVMLEDGSTGSFILPDGSFRAGGVHPSDAARQCSLESLESVEVWGESLLVNERFALETFLGEISTGGGSLEQGSGAIEGGLRAWQEETGGQSIFKLAYDTTAFREPRPVYADPATGQNQVIERSTQLKTFDLNTGLPLAEQETLYLHNGQVLGADQAGGSLAYAYYEILPADLAQVYAQVAARISSELKK